MQIEQLEQYIALLDAHNLTRLEFEQGETRLVLERQAQPQLLPQFQLQPQPQLMQQAGKASATASGKAPGKAAGANGQTETSPQENHGFAAHFCVVKAPLVGTAYKSRVPGEEPFVTVGSKVHEGDALCLLEAMKHYNEIVAPCSGTVTHVLFEDGDLAEFNLPLFVIEPES